MTRFEPSREDGRSDIAVITDLVAQAAPGTIFTYEHLIGALSEGTDREIDRKVAGRAVREARKNLLALYQRTMASVPNVGYRVAKAAEHKTIALDHRKRSERQLKWAVSTLQNVRWDEMDENSRNAHEAQLTIMGGMFQAIQAVRRTQDRHERMLRKLVEGKDSAA